MFTYTYVPKACKEKDAVLEGKIELKGIHYEKKIQMMDDLKDKGFGMDKFKSLQEDAEADPTYALKFMHAYVMAVKENIVKVELKDKENGAELKSYEDMASYPKCHGILNEIAMHLLVSGLGK